MAESPPASGSYFYDPKGHHGEPLFNALMKRLGFSPTTKEEGLREFQHRGWVLVYATYQCVDRIKGASRNRIIKLDDPTLVGLLPAWGRSPLHSPSRA